MAVIRDPQLGKTHRIRVCRVLTSKWDIYITPLSRIITEGAERLSEPEAVGDYKEIMSSGPSRTLACMNSQRLCQRPVEPKARQIPTWREEVDMKSHSQLSRYWQLIPNRRGKDTKNIISSKLTMLQWRSICGHYQLY